MAAPGKLSKQERKRQIQAKTSLNSPFVPKWTPLDKTDMDFILTTLKDKLLSIGLEKKEVNVFRPWRKKKAKTLTPEAPVPPPDQETRGQRPPKGGWTDSTARRQLAIGINEVTKALERNELRLVLVCKSAKPQDMTQHLIALSVTRQVPACRVPRLSLSLSEPLGLKSVLALGFRHRSPQENELFTDAVDAIIPRVPPLTVDWLPGPRGCQADEEMVETQENRGLKRKLDVETPEVLGSEPCTLQPLKVKKIIPNPSKNRMKKKKKD